MSFDGKRSHFESAVRAYAADLYRFAYWLCRDASVAEDLVQEAFARAWRSWKSLQDEKAVKAWLFVILRNEHARSFSRKRIESEDCDLDSLESQELAFQERMEVRDAVALLPYNYRETLLLQVLGGFTCEEIGAMTGVSAANVMTRLTRARQALRKLVDGREPVLRQVT